MGGPSHLLGIYYSLLSDNVRLFCVGQKNNVILRTGRILCTKHAQSTHRKVYAVNLKECKSLKFIVAKIGLKNAIIVIRGFLNGSYEAICVLLRELRC